MKRMYTLKELREIMRQSRAAQYQQRRAGKGPRELRIGRRVLVTEDALNEWLAALEGVPTDLSITGREPAAHAA